MLVNFSRLSPAIECDFSLNGPRLMAVLERLKAASLPQTIKVDNDLRITVPCSNQRSRRNAELIITLLAKLYGVLELSVDNCPVCQKAFSHDSECPISLAWSLLSDDQQRDARIATRALQLALLVTMLIRI